MAAKKPWVIISLYIHGNELQVGSCCCQLEYISLVYSFSHSPRQLFHTLPSFLKLQHLLFNPYS